jgi:hypothetical protein
MLNLLKLSGSVLGMIWGPVARLFRIGQRQEQAAASRPGEGSKEPRIWARHCCTQKAHKRLQTWVGAASWPAQVRDLSRGGIGLVLCQRHTTGEPLRLTVRPAHYRNGWTIDARVVHVELLPDGHWQTGCAFQHPIGEEEFNQLLKGA